MTIGRFLAGVGALVWHPTTNRYLLLRRSAEKDFAGGIWECVTGRVDQGEGFEQAVHREVREELGVSVRLDFIVGTTHFYRGESRPENELVGVVYSCSLDDPQSMKISPEHDEHRWVTPSEARELLPATEPSTGWIREVVERTAQIRSLAPVHLIEHFQKTGFELD